ncbi:LysR family transcriptional regulator [Vagococcus humatus]|nr:LysR family transcriptional regulator [Vagococcus humatus]
MEIRQLRYFIEIVKAGSYSTAAKNLFVTQPTLSWNMTNLQEEIGNKLFYQVGNHIKLTTVGADFYEESQKIVQAFDQLSHHSIEETFYEKKMLAIGSSEIISSLYLTSIQQFMQDHPNVTLFLEENDSLKTQYKVAHQELELGLVSYPIVESNLEIEENNHHTFQYHPCLIMSYTHPLGTANQLSFKQLKQETFISMSKDNVLYHLLEKKSNEYGFTPNISLVVNNYKTFIATVAATQAVGIVPLELKQDYQDFPLSWIPLNEKLAGFDIVIVHKKNEPLTPTAALLLEYLVNSHLEAFIN